MLYKELVEIGYKFIYPGLLVSMLDIDIDQLRGSNMLKEYQNEHNNQKHYFSEEGKTITSIEYDAIESFGKGLALKKADGNWDFILTSGTKEDIKISLDKINNY